jgi:methylmalonyl-CoA/ethylmalonyl-CoA epimerase
MVRAKKIEHIAVVVEDLDQALATFEQLFGVQASSREVVASQKTEAALLPIGDSNIELISPRGNEGLQRFIERRGSGLHHVAIEVDDLEQTLDALRQAGTKLIDETPRVGARGHRVAFVHPKATNGVLVELVQVGHEANGG